MAKSKSPSTSIRPVKPTLAPEAKGLLLLSLSFLFILGLLSFHTLNPKVNWVGILGHSISWGLNYTFGILTFPIVGFIGWLGWKLLLKGKIEHLKSKIFYFSLAILSLCILMNVLTEWGVPIPGSLKHKIITENILLKFPYLHEETRYNLGGVPAYFIYKDLPSFNLHLILSDFGTFLIFSMIACVSLLLFLDIHLPTFFVRLFSSSSHTEPKKQPTSFVDLEKTLSSPSMKTDPPLRIRTLSESEELPSPQPSIKKRVVLSGYQLPPPELLTSAERIDQPLLKKELKNQAEILEETLLSFGIEAKVGNINCGPTITSFEVLPAVGVKVQKIKTLENDIALKLQAKSIRIIAPIPGKAAVGIEIPSPYPQEVSFKEMLINYQSQPKKLQIPILLGKTVSGENVMSDLARMPHCLIAGATGSGKSVCINTIVMSIVMNARPDEIKLLMIDPKKVELTSYTHLPHMIAPVITEAHGAYSALNFLVKEMQNRYDILKQLGLRNISAFNDRSPNKELESSLSIPIPEKMYAIVAIIDEFADLMMASSSDLETPIARIAQMARAVGIHLILATQRPSREVITGLIKANFPTRIAFKVSSRINSQIIIDETGAEALLGNGDMLFLPPGSSHLMRAQGAYIRDQDINKVIEFISAQAPTNYLISSFDRMSLEEGASLDFGDEKKDALYEQAKQLVTETGNASTTFLQRKLKIGYARAASLIDELEAHGIVSPQEGSRPRQVLKDPHE